MVHPMKERVEWKDIPSCVKEMSEMQFYELSAKEDVYEVYGVSKESGALATVRPDGYVGMVRSLSDIDDVEAYFRRCLVTVDGS